MLVKSISESGGFEPVPIGTYSAWCYGLIELGHVEREFKGKKKIQHKVILLFEIPDHRVEYEDEDGNKINKPAICMKEYTALLSAGSNLRKDLEKWRGQKFTDEELDGWELNKVVGHPCTVSIDHTSGGKTKVDSVGKMMAGAKMKKMFNPVTVFEFEDESTHDTFNDLSKWFQLEIASSAEFKESALKVKPDIDQSDDSPQDDLTEIKDSLPF